MLVDGVANDGQLSEGVLDGGVIVDGVVGVGVVEGSVEAVVEDDYGVDSEPPPEILLEPVLLPGEIVRHRAENVLK